MWQPCHQSEAVQQVLHSRTPILNLAEFRKQTHTHTQDKLSDFIPCLTCNAETVCLVQSAQCYHKIVITKNYITKQHIQAIL
jgi:hypothetical protein